MNACEAREALRRGGRTIMCDRDDHTIYITPTGNGFVTVDIIFEEGGGDTVIESTVESMAIMDGDWEVVNLYEARHPMDRVFEGAHWVGDPVTLACMIAFVDAVDPRRGQPRMLDWARLQRSHYRL